MAQPAKRISISQHPFFIKKTGSNTLCVGTNENKAHQMSQQKRPRDEEPHRYAINAAGKWVHVIDAIVGDTYHCDCPKPHLLEVFESEFVHADEQTPDPNKVWTLQTKIGLAKQKLQILMPTLSFVTDECAVCRWTERFRFNIKEHHALYDTLNTCVITDHAGNPLYTLEIENQMDETSQLNIGFAKFKASDILQSTDARLTNLHILPITKCPQCESDAEARLKKKTANNVGKHKKKIKDVLQNRTKNQHWLHQDETTPSLKQISIQEAFGQSP